ncbi:MAG: ATP-binding cassette domain-containing protein [Acholeplasmatales bacterium]|nr:ATP-binding cassette domain-containing protein [Acholeplasmatales bacterium]
MVAMNSEIILKLIDVDIHFKIGKRTIKACNNINLDVYRGETLGIVGESGSGKSSIIKAILGINKVTKGSIIYNDIDISKNLTKKEKSMVKKSIQMIFQDPAASLNERANIEYIISEGLYNFKLFKDNEDRINKVKSMIENVGLLPEHMNRYPHEFSGGQRQRIGIARALIVNPDLVLADEPISALDVSVRSQVLNLLKELQNARDLTYIFIAHDLSIIKYISDRIAVMHNGYIVELGNRNHIYDNPIHPYTKSLLSAIPIPDPIIEKKRKRTVYEGNIDYSLCEWIEIEENHYVLANKEMLGKWNNDKNN